MYILRANLQVMNTVRTGVPLKLPLKSLKISVAKGGGFCACIQTIHERAKHL